MAVQGLGFLAHNAGGVGSIPGQGTKTCRPHCAAKKSHFYFICIYIFYTHLSLGIHRGLVTVSLEYQNKQMLKSLTVGSLQVQNVWIWRANSIFYCTCIFIICKMCVCVCVCVYKLIYMHIC